MDKLYEFRDGKVKEHLGSVQEFLQKRKLESLQELERKAQAPEQPEKTAAKKESAQAFQAQKFVSKEQRKIQNRVSFLEKEISKRETRMGEIEKVLANPSEKDDIMELTREYLELKMALDADTDEWTTLMEQLD